MQDAQNQEQEAPTLSILGPPVGYTDLLRDTLSQKSAAQLERQRLQGGDKNPIRPSSAGKCERELAYELIEHAGLAWFEKKPLDPELQLIFSLGHSVEYNILREFGAVDLIKVAYKQQSMLFFKIDAKNPKLSVHVEGSSDAAFISEKHGWRGLIDIKSKKVKHSKSFTDSWDELYTKLSGMKTITKIPDSQDAWWIEEPLAFLKELNDPFTAMNFWQLNLYANSDFFVAKGFDHCALIYYDKNSSRLRELRFKPSREMYDLTEARFRNAVAAADAADPDLAKAEFPVGSMKCAFCNYNKACSNTKDQDALKAFFKTLPPKYWPKEAGVLGEDFEAKLAEFHEIDSVTAKKEALERDLTAALAEAKIYKVRLGGIGGPVYELKTLKSGNELRRGKA